MRTSARMPPPPPAAVEDFERVAGDVDDRKIIDVGSEWRCSEQGGGDGFVVFAAECGRTQVCDAFDVGEAKRQPMKAAPAGCERAVGMMGVAAGLEVGPVHGRPAISRARRRIRRSTLRWASMRLADIRARVD
jgi:hypothetical protein